MRKDSWKGTNGSDSLSEKMLSRVKHEEPLAKKIEITQKSLQIPISKLRTIDEKLKARSDMLLAKIGESMKSRNEEYARIFATELAYVRKVKTMVGTTCLALEQLQMRLNTVSDLGDILVTLDPCMAIIKDMGPTISGMMPKATDSLSGFSEMLGDLMGGSNINAKPEAETSLNPDATAILEEITQSMERETGEVIPRVPEVLGKPHMSADERIPKVPDALDEQPVDKRVPPPVPRHLGVNIEELV